MTVTECVHCHTTVPWSEAYFWYDTGPDGTHKMVPLHPDTCWVHFVENDEPLRQCTQNDWLTDGSLTPEETLRRFRALHPEPTTGPATFTTGQQPVVLRWPRDAS